MLTDTKMSNLRAALHQIYVNLYVEFVVKNPLSRMLYLHCLYCGLYSWFSAVEHPGGVGVGVEMFEYGLERFIVCLLVRKPPTVTDIQYIEIDRSRMMVIC